MKEFFLSLWLSIMSIFGFTPVDEVQIDTPATIQEIPSGTPKQSAPASALEACNNKTVEENCRFILNENELNGICVPSGEQLACTPVLPQ